MLDLSQKELVVMYNAELLYTVLRPVFFKKDLLENLALETLPCGYTWHKQDSACSLRVTTPFDTLGLETASGYL